MIDYERYGGKRGYLAHLTESCKSLVGMHAALMKIDWPSVQRLVFVCKGNICRSPYAEARARSLGLNAISLGLEASPGASANAVALSEALQREIDLSSHRSRLVNPSEISKGDLVMFFELQHLRAFTSQIRGQPAVAVSLLGLWSHPRRPFISDPYGKSHRYFHECFGVIDSSILAIAQLKTR